MNALTVCQPYPELIARGDKPIENRTWETNYRGPLFIHAGKSRDWLDEHEDRVRYGIEPDSLVFGAVVAMAQLVACLPRHGRPGERARWGQHDYLYDHEHANGPWCWVLEDVKRLAKPVYCRGAQGLWMPTPDVVKAVLAEVA